MPVRSLIVFFFCCASCAQAQDSSHSFSRYTLEFAPPGIFFGKITIGGEYQLKPKNSVHFLVGIPFKKRMSVNVDNQRSSLYSKSFSLMGGYRYYMGKKVNSGAYIEPYLKYLQYEGEGKLNASLNGEDAIYDTRVDYSGLAFGAQLGAKFMLGRHLSLDLQFFGPEASTSKFNTSATDIASNQAWTREDATQAKKDVMDAVENIPIVGKRVVVDVEQSSKTIYTSYSGFLPGFRFGLSLGYRF